MTISKCLEKTVNLVPDGYLQEFGSSIQLEYYLVESEEKDIEELRGVKVYGIEIVKRKGKHLEERKTIRNLFCCKENAKTLLMKLVNNTVTPVTLPFILDDLLGA